MMNTVFRSRFRSWMLVFIIPVSLFISIILPMAILPTIIHVLHTCFANTIVNKGFPMMTISTIFVPMRVCDRFNVVVVVLLLELRGLAVEFLLLMPISYSVHSNHTSVDALVIAVEPLRCLRRLILNAPLWFWQLTIGLTWSWFRSRLMIVIDRCLLLPHFVPQCILAANILLYRIGWNPKFGTFKRQWRGTTFGRREHDARSGDWLPNNNNPSHRSYCWELITHLTGRIPSTSTNSRPYKYI